MWLEDHKEKGRICSRREVRKEKEKGRRSREVCYEDILMDQKSLGVICLASDWLLCGF